jgi:hypothetical protein
LLATPKKYYVIARLKLPYSHTTSEKDSPLWRRGSRKTSFRNRCDSTFRKYESRFATGKYVIITRFSNSSCQSLRTGKRQRRHLLCRVFAAFRLWSSGLLHHHCGSCLPKSLRDCYIHVKIRGEYAACTFPRKFGNHQTTRCHKKHDESKTLLSFSRRVSAVIE